MVSVFFHSRRICTFGLYYMENKTIARTLRLLGQLMELHEENPFKIKSIASAGFKIDKLPYPVSKKQLSEIETLEGIGKSTASKIWELLQTGKISEIEDFYASTPPGIIEILSIKGLGPKKVRIIWKDLAIENLGELFYACNENRLIEAKGFGLKTQEEIKKAIEFKIASNGRFLYAQTEEIAEYIYKQLKNIFPGSRVSTAGDYRRRCEIIDSLDFLTAVLPEYDVKNALSDIDSLTILSNSDKLIEAEHTTGLKLAFHFCSEDEFACELAFLTGSEKHTEELKARLKGSCSGLLSEADVYARAGLPFIEPELREGLNEFQWAEQGTLPELVKWDDLKGSLHNHSVWSDGVHTLEEMAVFCRDELQLQYLGICDHSKSAFYAKGLSEERVIAQQDEIDQLNEKLAGFRIFKGIESDILFDGSLDYPSEILARFDFVVASIHSVFKMNQEKATSRLISAIENPFTRILGHPTGRMLLTRNGYPVDFRKVIDACAANGVVIEINANPLRLDMDWRWHQYAIEKGVMLSINPDAHSNKGFYDTRYGILAARKGGVTAKDCLNALSAGEITNFFKLKR